MSTVISRMLGRSPCSSFVNRQLAEHASSRSNDIIELVPFPKLARRGEENWFILIWLKNLGVMENIIRCALLDSFFFLAQALYCECLVVCKEYLEPANVVTNANRGLTSGREMAKPDVTQQHSCHCPICFKMKRCTQIGMKSIWCTSVWHARWKLISTRKSRAFFRLKRLPGLLVARGI